jgi:predicted alpha/beta hydrolase family esterase
VAGIGGLLGGLQRNTLFQIAEYSVASTVLGGLLAPEADALAQTVYNANPIRVLSPELAAEAVLRNVWSHDQAAAEAQRSGYDRARFDVMARLAGNAPDPGSLAVALRRGFIDHARFLDGIRQGRLRDEWADLVQKLSVQQPSPTDPLEALLQGQLSEARARKLYAEFGGDPVNFDWLFDSRGSAPSPVQAADMANRGIIPWGGKGPNATSYEQAFLEGPWRNKWLAPMQKAAQYYPPPRTVTAMYREGSLTRARSMELLQAQGLPADLAAAYLVSGSNQKTAKTRDLAQSTIATLYRERLITRDAAASSLTSMGYDAAEAELLLEVVDVEVVQRFLNAAIGRVHTLYVGHKISRSDAQTALADLGVPASNLTDMLGIWDLERAANVRTLTPTDLVAAVRQSLLSEAEGLAELEALGYQPHDAWLYLSVHLKRAVGGQPAPGALPPPPGP